MKTSFKETIIIFIKGLTMGIADVVPGVSGGTIAFITGIYYRLINSISQIKVLVLLKAVFSFKPRKLKTELSRIDFPLFLPLGLGILISIFIFSKVVQQLLESWPGITYAFFFGLILASAVLIFKKSGAIKFEKIIFGVLGFIGAYVLAGLPIVQANHTLGFIFLSGALAIIALILPGISGAFVLLLLGQYEYLITALHEFNYSVILTFAIGGLMGLLSFSRLLNLLLHKFRGLTLFFLVGVMLGALRSPASNISANGGYLGGGFLYGQLWF